MKMTRQKMIMELLVKHNMVNTNDLADTLGVSVETVRRDFAQMEKAGLLKKIYGGALPSEHLELELRPWQERSSRCQAEKAAIAAHALQYIPDNALIATDAGTTMFELARLLKARNGLTVITNDLPLAHEMVGSPGNQIYMIGGLFSPSGVTTGLFAKEFLQNFSRIDICMISTDALTLDDGLTITSTEMNEVKKLFLSKADKCIALVDHSKFGSKALFRTCGFKEIDLLITDEGAPPDFVNGLRDRGLQVEVVPVPRKD